MYWDALVALLESDRLLPRGTSVQKRSCLHETGAGDIPRGVAANRADRKQASAVRGRQRGGRHRGRAGSGHVHRLGAARQGVADCPTAAGPSGGPRRRTRADVGVGAVGSAPTGYADLPACRRDDNSPLPNRLRASTLSPTAARLAAGLRPRPRGQMTQNATKCYRENFAPTRKPKQPTSERPVSFRSIPARSRPNPPFPCANNREPIGATPSQSVRPEHLDVDGRYSAQGHEEPLAPRQAHSVACRRRAALDWDTGRSTPLTPLRHHAREIPCTERRRRDD